MAYGAGSFARSAKGCDRRELRWPIGFAKIDLRVMPPAILNRAPRPGPSEAASRAAKLRAAAALALGSPREFMAKVRSACERRFAPERAAPERERVSLPELAARLADNDAVTLSPYLAEPAIEEIARAVSERAASLESEGAFKAIYSGDADFVRALYALCRALRPALVVETGVAYGKTSAYILAALRANGTGRLISIDLPPLGGTEQVKRSLGCLVPSSLHGNWELRRGDARTLLPRVLREAGAPGIFIHDSLHTYRHMLWEFRTAARDMRGGAIVADDVDLNAAFDDWASAAEVPAYFVKGGEKSGTFGLALLAGTRHP